MDHTNAKDTDNMRHLTRPRGDGKGYVFRMVTPLALKGHDNPRTGKPFGNEIKLGLNTRHLPTARLRRDVILGELRVLELGQDDRSSFSLQSALDWREDIAAARKSDPSGRQSDAMEMVLTSRLQAVEDGGKPLVSIQSFARVALGNGFPLSVAQPKYVIERSPGNAFGFKSIKPSTAKELDIALSHLRRFLGDTEGTACMEDIKPEVARLFRQEYLPSIISKQTKGPMSARTADKYITMLRPMWDWAVSNRKLTAVKYQTNPWIFDRSVPVEKNSEEPKREPFNAEEMTKLLAATKRGTRGGDAVRLSIATGVRINELVLLHTENAEPDGSGFYLRVGKTKNAVRYIPLVGDARDLMSARLAAHGATGRAFPEWPIKPSTGRCGAITRWFIDFRRKVLGVESEGRLVLHSTRHTWRTAARRAGVVDADVNDLGGWAGPKTSNSIYDHGLLKEHLQEAQGRIWAELKRGGYLESF